MKSFYSIQEVISLSKNTLSITDIKHYCRLGKLHPCIYFEGNLVCISEKRHQNSLCKTGPVAHVEEVKWSMIFKGYINFSNLINHLDPAHNKDSDVFYNVDKVVEFITQPTTYAPLLPLSNNEILKAFPRIIDDDIKEIRWLVEAINFKGNTFSPREILFSCAEVDALFNPLDHQTLSDSITKSIDTEFKESDRQDLLNQLENMNQQYETLQKEKLQFLKKIQSLEIELETQNTDSNILHQNKLSQPIQAKHTKYTTPALEALFGVINEHWIGYDPEGKQPPPKQAHITNWIKENYREVQAEDICKYIDKICRHPKAKKGGNSKQK